MKTNNSFLLLTACVALIAAGCKEPPKSKTIVGASVPALDTNQFTGTWHNANDKSVIATRIKNAGSGVIELASLRVSREEIKLVNLDVTLRQSPVGLLWSASEKSFADNDKDGEELPGHYYFGRLVIGSQSLVVYLPDGDEIETLAKRGHLKVTYARNEKGEDVAPPILDGLGKEQFDNLLTNGVNPLVLFNSDPAAVFTRLNDGD